MSDTDWNTQVLQQANYVQEVLGGVNADKIPVGAISGAAGYFPNALVNGGFELWNRGAGAFTTNAAKTADQWKALLAGGSSYTLSQSGSPLAAASRYAAGGNYTHVGGGSLTVQQSVENYLEYKGKTVSFSAACYSLVGSSLLIGLTDGVSPVFSGYAPANTLTTLSVSLAVSNSATALVAFFFLGNASTASFMLDNAILAVGSVAPPWAPEPYGEGVMRAERYWQQVKANTAWRTSTAGETHSDPVYWRVQMASAPTVAIAAGTRANITSAAAGNVTANGCSYDTVATATTTATSVANDVLTADAFFG